MLTSVYVTRTVNMQLLRVFVVTTRLFAEEKLNTHHVNGIVP